MRSFRVDARSQPLNNMRQGAEVKSKDLTKDDWEEIYYALDRQAFEIKRGTYDDDPGEVTRPNSETARWAIHIREVMIKIKSRWESGSLPR